MKMTDKSWKVSTHTSRKTYFIYIFFGWLTETMVLYFVNRNVNRNRDMCKKKTKTKPLGSINLFFDSILVWF